VEGEAPAGRAPGPRRGLLPSDACVGPHRHLKLNRRVGDRDFPPPLQLLHHVLPKSRGRLFEARTHRIVLDLDLNLHRHQHVPAPLGPLGASTCAVLRGRIERVVGRLFEGEEAVLHVIERIVAPLGLRVDATSPWVDARLPDGSRVHAIVPPLSLCGPVLNVRKFSSIPLGPAELLANGTLGFRMLGFLAACVRGRLNIVISGGTSSGKTTLLGVLSSFVPQEERLITIEDAAELRLAQPHVIGLEARPASVEGRGEVTVRDLVRNSLRMRPDRIVVGEVRGGEALDMLQAMNTGHDGSLSTAHANSARHALWRLETMALMSDVDLPVAHVRAQVASAIDVVVHTARLRDGRRVVFQIAAVDELDGAGDPVVIEVFGFRPRVGRHGAFVCTGIVPRVVASLAERGEDLDPRCFDAGIDGSEPT
jgi:pilus assembly protein CpaF